MGRPQPLAGAADRRPPGRQGQRPDSRRTLWLVTVCPYPMLGALAVVTVIAKRHEPGSLAVDLALCAATALWMLWMFTLHPAWRKRTAPMVLFFTGLMVLTGALIVRDPWFGLFTPAGYFFAFELLPWPWRLAGVGAVALNSGNAQTYGVSKDNPSGITAFATVLAVNVICMCGLAWWEWTDRLRAQEREEALAQVREANRRLETTLAENAGLHKQLLVQAREAGVLDERQRMAREIHDTLAQGLAGIVTQLQAAEQAEADPGQWRRHFTAATRLARESLAEARRSVDALRPQPLETAGLGEALAGVADHWSALHTVPVRVAATGVPRPMPPETELALLRAAQEALANVARHARAGTVTLSLGYLDDEVTLEVSDDGRGFRPAGDRTARSRAGGGFGLKAMRERIEGVSGTLRVHSAPGSGTTVTARVPLVPAGARA